MNRTKRGIDIRQYLENERSIADIWNIEDVQSLRNDLTDEEAWHVLQTIEKQLDSNLGITWDAIENVANQLYPTNTSLRRPL